MRAKSEFKMWRFGKQAVFDERVLVGECSTERFGEGSVGSESTVSASASDDADFTAVSTRFKMLCRCESAPDGLTSPNCTGDSENAKTSATLPTMMRRSKRHRGMYMLSSAAAEHRSTQHC